MSVITLKKIDEIHGKIVFYKLLKDDKCFFDDFEEEIENEGTYSTELNTAQTLMIQISDLRCLPAKKFKDITPQKVLIKEYEIKTKNLRIYLFKDPKGNIIVLGGKKTNQKSDLKKFRNLKKEYLKNNNLYL